MPLPIICAYDCLQQYLMSYRDLFSKPQYKYFVIVLLGFIQCQQARTLSGLQRSVAQGGSLSGLSRFFALAPWDTATLVARGLERFRAQMTPVVQAELTRQQEVQPKRRGRPKAPVVTGYLIGDDSTMHKEKALTLHFSKAPLVKRRGVQTETHQWHPAGTAAEARGEIGTDEDVGSPGASHRW